MAKIQSLHGRNNHMGENDDTPLNVLSFNRFGKHPLMWLEQSRSLHRAAVALMKPKSMWCKAMMPEVNAPIVLM